MTGDGAALVAGTSLGVAVAAALWQGRRGVGTLGARASDAPPGRFAHAALLRRLRGRHPQADRVRVVVAQVTALLAAGAPPGAAWTRAAGVPVDPLGVPDAAALGAVVGTRSAHAVCAATRLALTVGAPLGRVLDAVSDALAAEAEAAAEREAALAGPRTTARVLLWLPGAGALLGWSLGADPLAAATDGGAGTAATCAGLVLLAVGRWWTERLIESARRVGDPP